MSAIDLDTVVSRAQGFSTAAVHDEIMMLSIEQDAYYSLDPIAAQIWNMLEQPTRVRDLAERLQQRYAVAADQCQADVLTFLAELHKNGMILVA